ncbi:MAG TPA: hypothetical protein VFL47_10400, partial [Flavisolibacter sp.]|nr:hypothetical protein [Flavisolibacter sp.]
MVFALGRQNYSSVKRKEAHWSPKLFYSFLKLTLTHSGFSPATISHQNFKPKSSMKKTLLITLAFVGLVALSCAVTKQNNAA